MAEQAQHSRTEQACYIVHFADWLKRDISTLEHGYWRQFAGHPRYIPDIRAWLGDLKADRKAILEAKAPRYSWYKNVLSPSIQASPGQQLPGNENAPRSQISDQASLRPKSELDRPSTPPPPSKTEDPVAVKGEPQSPESPNKRSTRTLSHGPFTIEHRAFIAHQRRYDVDSRTLEKRFARQFPAAAASFELRRTNLTVRSESKIIQGDERLLTELMEAAKGYGWYEERGDLEEEGRVDIAARKRQARKRRGEEKSRWLEALAAAAAESGGGKSAEVEAVVKNEELESWSDWSDDGDEGYVKGKLEISEGGYYHHHRANLFSVCPRSAEAERRPVSVSPPRRGLAQGKSKGHGRRQGNLSIADPGLPETNVTVRAGGDAPSLSPATPFAPPPNRLRGLHDHLFSPDKILSQPDPRSASPRREYGGEDWEGWRDRR